jgi:molybdopterin/thiamine biosynthesis adenylyltransferase
MRIDGWKQDKVQKATVLVAGVGALGSFITTNLTLTGVGHLIIVDMDTIEVSNLNRQLLFRKADVRKYKAEIAAKRLRKMNPEVNITPLPKKIENINRTYYKKADVIVAGLDTFPARRWLNSLAVHLKKPLITGGMYGLMGHVQRIIPYQTPCFECQPLIPQNKLSQECSPLGEIRKKERQIPKEKKEPLPAVTTISMIIGGILSQEVLKQIMDLGEPLDNYLFYDGTTNETTILKLQRNYQCPVCGEFYDLKEGTITIANGETIGQLQTRIAYAFGLAKPQIMLNGIMLDENLVISNKNLTSGTKIFIIDERLAKPLMLVLKKQRRRTSTKKCRKKKKQKKKK